MFNILLVGIVCFFAAFGVVQFVDLILCQCKEARGKIISVIPLHNNERDAECIVRSSFLNHNKIIAVDYGSYDNTLQILHGLKKEFPGLSIFTQEEFIDYLKDYCNVERNEF